MRNVFTRAGALIAVAATTVLATLPASAAYPDKPVRIIVPFAPGGGTDLDRAHARYAGMSKELGQPVIVDNKPGAGTIIGTDAVAKSPPDGYTLRHRDLRACRQSERCSRSFLTRATRRSRPSS